MKPSSLTFDTVRQAHARIASGLRLTPCAYSARLSDVVGISLFCKRDFEQVTGSFKERGARNALLSLSPEEASRGVIAASAGNHGLGLAHHGALLRISVTVVMPHGAPQVKVERCRTLGAQVILHGANYDEASEFAQRRAQDKGLTYVHPFDNLAVMAGQGTLALEVLEQVPEFDAMIVPVGGGGLLAGVTAVLKSVRPDVEIIAVEPAHAAGWAVARAEGKPVTVPVSSTFADGLAVRRVGARTFALANPRVDRVLTVTEDELAEALLLLADQEDTVVEGAGAAALAACVSGRLGHLLGKRVVLPLCGRNIDPHVHARALARARSARSWAPAA